MRVDGEDILMETSWDQCLALADEMRARGVKPEWECYSHADLCLVKKLFADGADTPPYSINLVFGTDAVFLSSLPYRPAYLAAMVEELPPDTNFSVEPSTARHHELIASTTSNRVPSAGCSRSLTPAAPWTAYGDGPLNGPYGFPDQAAIPLDQRGGLFSHVHALGASEVPAPRFRIRGRSARSPAESSRPAAATIIRKPASAIISRSVFAACPSLVR
jgi:hypothetical protein